MVQITPNEGRSVELKKTLYKALAERLHDELVVGTEDLFANLIGARKENRSFGNGVAQSAP